jgi:acetoin utilization deacetylase AcuC-like enzyme
MTRTGYAWDPMFLGHRTTTVNPEHPDRAQVLAAERMLSDVPGLVPVKVDQALGAPGILRVHPVSYLTEIREAFAHGRRSLDGGDTLVAEDTFEVAVRSASAALSVTEGVLAGRLDNGFAAVRPPGHHALTNRARGFCVFNNAAICARFAQSAFDRVTRVLIVDWDVHPADGTMSVFYDDPTVHVLSLHQDGIFGKDVGSADQRGRGPGEGATYNVPLPERTRATAYVDAFEHALDVASVRCRPDLIIISCGFDAHAGDPIGRLSLEDETYAHLTRAVKRVARQHCGGRVVSLLEGGYQLDILRRCARIHLETLLE